MYRRLKGFTFLTLALSLILAAEFPPAAAADPCQGDIARLCKGVPPGGGRILECLKGREAEISPACKAHVGAALQQIKTQVANWQTACRPDVERLCKGVPPGEGRILECLKAHEAEISPACKEHAKAKLQEVKTNIQNWQKACWQDAQRLCKDVPLGQGRLINCLQEHIEQVSPECKGSLR